MTEDKDNQEIIRCEDHGHESIMNSKDCRLAAKRIGKKIGKNFLNRTKAWPRGCLASGRRAHYNGFGQPRQKSGSKRSTKRRRSKRKIVQIPYPICYEKKGN